MGPALTAVALALALSGAVLAMRAEEPPPVFRVGIHGWPGFAPAYLAREDGDWPSGLIRAVELPTDAAIVRAMEGEVLEAACLTLDEALRVQQAGVETRVLAVADESMGGDAIVAVRGDLGSVADLRGRRVAVESHGVGMLLLARALRGSGLGIGDLVVVNADVPEHPRLIAQGQVDAVVTFSPETERLVEAGGVVLCDSASMPGLVIDVLVVRADAIRSNPGAARVLRAGWLDAADRLEADPRARARAARAMGMTPAEYDSGRRSLRIPDRSGARALNPGASPDLAGDARRVAEELGAIGLLRGPTEPARLLPSPDEAEVLRW
ncbi:ABC transporter substrate-binding protein [Tautonia plasticadhaerens]|uniref:ABC transporter substrate-binding protein n=1 Tax=Tautonia plasticadhaerens TaxID=2527974 RepID=UPI0018D203E6|nr:ABC transporter substrate-binding protein [Tautonia plasticadhaerens]